MSAFYLVHLILFYGYPADFVLISRHTLIEFSLRSSNELVKRVEAALAGAEPMLTPPRSSPESPDRSSSPESESGVVIVRDNMSLPIRKRKLYLKDDGEQQQQQQMAAATVTTRHGLSEGTNNELNQSQRKSSVIQFAKSS